MIPAVSMLLCELTANIYHIKTTISSDGYDFSIHQYEKIETNCYTFKLKAIPTVIIGSNIFNISLSTIMAISDKATIKRMII